MPLRSQNFRTRSSNRYWWFRNPGHAFVPPIYSFLRQEEWDVLDAWYTDTDVHFPASGECNVPAMSFIHGLVMGSGIRGVVQLGHFMGYSTLLLGFMMRRMGFERSVFSIDIDKKASDYTQSWIQKADLGPYVKVFVSDSAAPSAVAGARSYLGSRPSMVFVDSSHGYQHTLRELDVWYPELRPGGLMLLHDASQFAAQFDPSHSGGVRRALAEWLPQSGASSLLMNSDASIGVSADSLVYGDPCGLGIIQKSISERAGSQT